MSCWTSCTGTSAEAAGASLQSRRWRVFSWMDADLSTELGEAEQLLDRAGAMALPGMLDVAHGYRHLPADERRRAFLRVMEVVERSDLHAARERLVQRTNQVVHRLAWTSLHGPEVNESLQNAFAEAILSASLAHLVRRQLSQTDYELLFRPLARYFSDDPVQA